MRKRRWNTVSFLLNGFIALVWLINGLFCKLLNLVPRHEAIVARILGQEHSLLLTKLIGIAELGVCVWVLIGKARRLATIVQVIVVAVMNTLEFFLAPDLLMFGKGNALFATAFICILIWNEKLHPDLLRGRLTANHKNAVH